MENTDYNWLLEKQSVGRTSSFRQQFLFALSHVKPLKLQGKKTLLHWFSLLIFILISRLRENFSRREALGFIAHASIFSQFQFFCNNLSVPQGQFMLFSYSGIQFWLLLLFDTRFTLQSWVYWINYFSLSFYWTFCTILWKTYPTINSPIIRYHPDYLNFRITHFHYVNMPLPCIRIPSE